MVRSIEGKRILVTRAAEQAEEFSQAIAERGATPVEAPVIAFKPVKDRAVDEAVAFFPQYQWIVFTSANGVRFLFELLRGAGQEFPAGVKVAVIGKKTLSALQSHGINVELIPDEFVAENLLQLLKKELEPGNAVLLPRGNLARKVLPDSLVRLGAKVTDLTIYETAVNWDCREVLVNSLSGNELDVVTFTSSSTVESLFQLLEGLHADALLSGKIIACIGPITAQTARDFGLEPDIVSDEYTTSGLLDAIEQFYGSS